MLTIMRRCVVVSVVGKLTLKVTPVLVNVGYLAKTANGKLQM